MTEIQSDWGDWLVRDVEDATPDGVAVWYLGCNGFILKGSEGTTVYVDPYVGLGYPPRTVRMIPVPFDPADVTDADAVLATHEHTDHVHGPSQAPILENTDATFYAPDDSLDVARDEEEWTQAWDVDDGQFSEVTEGDTLEIGEFTVHVEDAHDPDATHPVSYVFEHDAGTLFHGGDTKPNDEFERIGTEYDIDVGILAFGTVGQIADKETGEPKRTRWYNDENQIIEIASALELDRLLPSHWDMWRGLTSDPKVLYHHAKSFEHPRQVDVIEIGDRIDLE
ncbi:MBL fold metallo-hydrolase [Natrarchaeobius chitinivorans]|uniref:MBL fold metallo-hydrolase n=1 Tax=Natrarchaeobius chitinivorans TaxID=1679083 RepID=A0A3N6MJ11_NATCH|nr:MBL fold metallo-hydrolase [Natrarchaeobius chitinivorans]RQG97010.1 MBL fold metallo-hydrolase [Natrarchaeobius chitinivorans]